VLSSKEDVAALLARKRGLAAASAIPGGAAGGDVASTPAAALFKRPGGVGATPASGAGGEKRPAIKRPAMRTPASGDPKRGKLGAGSSDASVSRMWDKVLGGGGGGAAGAAGLRPPPSTDAHLRRVYVSDLPPSIDQLELRNVRAACPLGLRVRGSHRCWGGDAFTAALVTHTPTPARSLCCAQSMLRYGGVEDVRLDVHTGTAFITFNDVERAKKLVGAAPRRAFSGAVASAAPSGAHARTRNAAALPR
jgi:hypothetical protein